MGLDDQVPGMRLKGEARIGIDIFDEQRVIDAFRTTEPQLTDALAQFVDWMIGYGILAPYFLNESRLQLDAWHHVAFDMPSLMGRRTCVEWSTFHGCLVGWMAADRLRLCRQKEIRSNT
ncbi:hypothetical protein ACFSUK_12155 [Sphingobium scionense]